MDTKAYTEKKKHYDKRNKHPKAGSRMPLPEDRENYSKNFDKIDWSKK